jgi:hypothetical protein
MALPENQACTEMTSNDAESFLAGILGNIENIMNSFDYQPCLQRNKGAYMAPS